MKELRRELVLVGWLMVFAGAISFAVYSEVQELRLLLFDLFLVLLVTFLFSVNMIKHGRTPIFWLGFIITILLAWEISKISPTYTKEQVLSVWLGGFGSLLAGLTMPDLYKLPKQDREGKK